MASTVNALHLPPSCEGLSVAGVDGGPILAGAGCGAGSGSEKEDESLDDDKARMETVRALRSRARGAGRCHCKDPLVCRADGPV